MANEVAKGSFEEIIERIKSTKLSRFLNPNPKTNANTPPKMTPEEKTIALAAGVFGTPSQDSTRESLVAGLENKKEEYKKNPSEELKKEIELEEEQLKLFDKTISDIKQQKLVERTEKEKELYNKAQDSEKRINEIVDEFSKNLQTLIESIEKGEKENISTMIKVLTAKYSDYTSNLKTLNDEIKAYNDYRGKDDYSVSHKKIQITEEQVEKIYKGIKIQIDELTQMKFGFNKTALNKGKYIKEYQTFIIAGLPKYFGDKEKFKEIKEKIDAELAAQNLNPAEKAKEEAQEKIDKLLADLFKEYKEDFKKYEINITTMDVKNKVGAIVEEYDVLSSEEKQKLIDNAVNNFNKMVQNEYSKELLDVLEEIGQIESLIEDLEKTKYTDEELKTKYGELIAKIKELRNSEKMKKVGATLVLDEANFKVHYIFKSDKINDLSRELVSEKIKLQLQGQPKPIETPKEKAKAALEIKLTELASKKAEEVTPEIAKAEYEKAIETIDNLTDTDKKELIDEYLQKLNKIRREKEIDEKITKKLNELFEEYKNKIKKLNTEVDKFKVMAEIGNILDDYDELSKEEKEQYITDSLSTFNQKINKEYGELFELINRALQIKSTIAELDKIDPTTPEFKTKYEKLVGDIKKLDSDELTKKLGANVTLDSENYKVHFIFKSEKIDDITMDLVNQKAKEHLKPSKPISQGGEQPTGPENPTPSEEEKNAAIQEYIEILKELEKEIKALNFCNSNVETAASITFDNITIDKIDSIIAMEQTALKHDANIIDKQLELANARANLRIKYNCYVSTIKEITDFKMPKIEFGKSYKDFVDYYDEMIVIAEKKIMKLDEERQQDYTPESRANELTKEMRKLADYIECVNSLIGRRIVAASLEDEIDIVSFLKDRRDKKREIRKQIQDMLDKELAQKPKVNQEEAEKELREKLREVYGEWIRQYEYSLSTPTITINPDEYQTRIDEIVKQSKADKKYEIAEDFKNNFEQEKNRVTKNQKDKNLKLKIEEIFEQNILTVIEIIRNDKEYISKFEEICFSEDLKAKISAVLAASDSENKDNILEDVKNNYSNKVKEIIKREQIDQRRNFLAELEKTKNEISNLEIDEDFLTTIEGKYNAIRVKYNVLFGKIEMTYDFSTNKVFVKYPYKKYNGTIYANEFAQLEIQAMTEEMFKKYIEFKNKKPTPQPEPQLDNITVTETELLSAVMAIMSNKNPKTEFLINVIKMLQGYSDEKAKKVLLELDKRGVIKLNEDGTYLRLISSYEEYTAKFHNANTVISPKVEAGKEQIVPDIRVNNGKTLKFVSNVPQHVTKLNGKILTADKIQLTLIKNGLKIKYSENLRNQLQALNAKLSLVNKNQYRSRTSTAIDPNKEEQIVAFKSKKADEFKIEDYKIQIRADKVDENGKKIGGSDLVYEMEIDEQLADELRRGRTL